MSKRVARWVLSVVFLAGACAPALAADSAPPAPTRYVTDTAGVLSAKTSDAVDAELKAYEKATGHQIIVWIGESTGGVPLETWTVDTAHRWRVGHKGKDDGAILFLFTKDRKVRIEVGYGLEGRLTDADSKRIIEDSIVPAMRAGDPNRAVSDGAAAILTTITPTYSPAVPAGSPPPDSSSSDDSLPPWVVIVFFVIPFCAIFAFIMWRAFFRKGAWSGIVTSGGGSASSSSSDDSFSSSGSDDFSSGGGDFGGGGASGGW